MQLRATLTQSGANTFVQAAVNTGLQSSGNQGYKLLGMTVEYPDFVTAAATAITKQSVQASRASKSAISNLADDDIILMDVHKFYYATGVGQVLYPGVEEVRPESEILIIEEQIFIGYNTVNAGAAYTAIVLLEVEPARITTDQRIQILQSRLN